MDIRQILNQSFKSEFDNARSEPNKREKRIRSAFTTDQIMSLEKEFKKSPYIGIVNRKEIANILKIPERAVKIWFQNRRMKEKKDGTHKEHHHYDTTGLNSRVVNDQLNNNLYSHSILPQSKPTTNFNEMIIDNFLKKNRKHVLIKSTENREIGKSNTENAAVSPYFQNDTITSSTNDANRNAQFSIELLKKYKNNSHINTMKKTIKHKSTPQARPNQTRKRKMNEITERSETCNSSSHATLSMQHQQMLTQIPPGYVPLYPQQNYQQCLSAGNVLWKPIDPAGMATGISMRDFALLPNPQAVPYTHTNVAKHVNTQRNKCSCNCHVNPHQTPVAFAQENQIPQPQYVIAIPFPKNPVQFSSPI